MARYSCPLAEEIGHRYRLSPGQVQPAMLRKLAGTWTPRGQNLSAELNTAADQLAAELDTRGLPLWVHPWPDEDGHAMARAALANGGPGAQHLLAELEAGWARQNHSD